MHTDASTEPEPESKAEPYATCRLCGGEIGRTELVAIWRSAKQVAHVACYDAHWLNFDLADAVGGDA